MKIDLKGNIKGNIAKKIPVSDTNANADTNIKEIENNTIKFRLAKKADDKSQKKSFPLYMDSDLKDKLDDGQTGLCKKTGYSRNELINLMIKFCVDHFELIEK